MNRHSASNELKCYPNSKQNYAYVCAHGYILLYLMLPERYTYLYVKEGFILTIFVCWVDKRFSFGTENNHK